MISTKAFVIIGLLAATPAVAGPLVVRALGPSSAAFRPGQRLADNAPLVLRAGDQLTILDARGTRSFSGPGSFRVDSASAVATPTAFAELLTQKPVRRARIGAVRGPGSEISGKPVPPGLWLIDAGAGGNVCALDPAKLALWRAEPLAAGTIAVSRSDNGGTRTIGFAAGQAVANWPAGLALADGERYRIIGAGAPAVVTIRKLAAAKSLDDLGEALLEAGCTAQFDRLASLTALPGAPLP